MQDHPFLLLWKCLPTNPLTQVNWFGIGTSIISCYHCLHSLHGNYGQSLLRCLQESCCSECLCGVGSSSLQSAVTASTPNSKTATDAVSFCLSLTAGLLANKWKWHCFAVQKHRVNSPSHQPKAPVQLRRERVKVWMGYKKGNTGKQRFMNNNTWNEEKTMRGINIKNYVTVNVIFIEVLWILLKSTLL